MNENTIQHLGTEQLRKINEIQMINKEGFDAFYKSYCGSSIYRTGKEYAEAYAPRIISSYLFSEGPTDFLIKQVLGLSSQNGITDRQKSMEIAKLLRNYITERSNFEYKFCKYLINNLSSLVNASSVLALTSAPRNTGPEAGA